MDARDTEDRRQRIEKNKNKGYGSPIDTFGDDKTENRGQRKAKEKARAKAKAGSPTNTLGDDEGQRQWIPTKYMWG